MKKNRGFSLIELLIASSVGLLAIGVVGTVFISGSNTANKRSLELMLQQDVNDALYLIKQDLLRAGYYEGNGSSYIVSGATDIVTLWDTVTDNPPLLSQPADCVTYAYHDGMVQHFGSFYTKVGSDSSGDSVNILRLYKTTTPTIDLDNKCTTGQSLLDQNQIQVSHFQVYEEPIIMGSIKSRLIKIELSAYLKKSPFITVSKAVQVKVRNWQ